jgi:hypothetical protein
MDNFLRVVGKNLEREGMSNVFGESHESSSDLRGLLTSNLSMILAVFGVHVHNVPE